MRTDSFDLVIAVMHPGYLRYVTPITLADVVNFGQAELEAVALKLSQTKIMKAKQTDLRQNVRETKPDYLLFRKSQSRKLLCLEGYTH